METTLRLDNRPAEIATASGWLLSLCASLGLSRETAFRLDLCLNETLQNITQYSTATWIQVALSVDEAQAVLSILDDGQAFDPLVVQEPVIAASLQTAQVGGWGVQLLRTFSDGLNYERRDQRNSLRLTFRIR